MAADQAKVYFAIKPKRVHMQNSPRKKGDRWILMERSLEGNLRPSSDTSRMRCCNNYWEDINGVAYTHSMYATAWDTNHSGIFHYMGLPVPIIIQWIFLYCNQWRMKDQGKLWIWNRFPWSLIVFRKESWIIKKQKWYWCSQPCPSPGDQCRKAA